MTNGSFGVAAQNQAQLGGADTTQQLQKLFTGRVIGAPAFPPGGMTGVVVGATDTEVVVTVDGFDPTGQATFTCNYQPRFDWTGGTKTQITPPTGTPCFIAFAGNGSGLFPWVIAFSGWPS